MNKPYLSLFNAAALLALLLTVPASPALADSLWQDGNSRPMVGDKRAAAVGDILSIVVQENSTANKDNTTKTSKKSSIDASLNTVLYSPAGSSFLTKIGQMPALNISAKQDFDGGGKINNSEKMIARIAVRVVDVLPNQNLVIEGRRQTAFASETQDIILRGVVRPADITSGNIVFSYHVADATIRIISKGTITDNQRKGWFTRVWEKLAPF